MTFKNDVKNPYILSYNSKLLNPSVKSIPTHCCVLIVSEWLTDINCRDGAETKKMSNSTYCIFYLVVDGKSDDALSGRLYPEWEGLPESRRQNTYQPDSVIIHPDSRRYL